LNTGPSWEATHKSREQNGDGRARNGHGLRTADLGFAKRKADGALAGKILRDRDVLLNQGCQLAHPEITVKSKKQTEREPLHPRAQQNHGGRNEVVRSHVSGRAERDGRTLSRRLNRSWPTGSRPDTPGLKASRPRKEFLAQEAGEREVWTESMKCARHSSNTWSEKKERESFVRRRQPERVTAKAAK
jgi:hypothetical protein